jgi:hypothetical protein
MKEPGCEQITNTTAPADSGLVPTGQIRLLRVSLFSLFFPEIYSERTLVRRRKSWAPQESAGEKQRKRSLFSRCFPLFLNQRNSREGAPPPAIVSAFRSMRSTYSQNTTRGNDCQYDDAVMAYGGARRRRLAENAIRQDLARHDAPHRQRQDYAMPATIDDPAVLRQIEGALRRSGIVQ